MDPEAGPPTAIRYTGAMPPAAYACAIIRDKVRGFLLEERDDGARHAAGLCTCFGGRREPGETSREALLRELFEELGWVDAPVAAEPAVRFYVSGDYIADFYVLPAPAAPVCRLPDREATWRIDADDPAISPWHRAVLTAWLAGETRCEVTGSSSR